MLEQIKKIFHRIVNVFKNLHKAKETIAGYACIWYVSLGMWFMVLTGMPVFFILICLPALIWAFSLLEPNEDNHETIQENNI